MHSYKKRSIQRQSEICCDVEGECHINEQNEHKNETRRETKVIPNSDPTKSCGEDDDVGIHKRENSKSVASTTTMNANLHCKCNDCDKIAQLKPAHNEDVTAAKLDSTEDASFCSIMSMNRSSPTTMQSAEEPLYVNLNPADTTYGNTYTECRSNETLPPIRCKSNDIASCHALKDGYDKEFQAEYGPCDIKPLIGEASGGNSISKKCAGNYMYNQQSVTYLTMHAPGRIPDQPDRVKNKETFPEPLSSGSLSRTEDASCGASLCLIGEVMNDDIQCKVSLPGAPTKIVRQVTDEHGYIPIDNINGSKINRQGAQVIEENDNDNGGYVKGCIATPCYQTDEHGYIIMQDNDPEGSPGPKLPARRSKITILFDTPDGDTCPDEPLVKTYILGTGFPATCSKTDVIDFINFIQPIHSRDVPFEVDFDAWTGEACIEFQSSKDARAFLNRVHIIQPCHLQRHLVKFRKSRRLEKDPYSALLCGIPDTTSDEDLAEFLEKKCHLRPPKRITRGTRPGAAVVTYEQQLAIDKLSEVCEQRACQGHFLTTHAVNESTSARVSGFKSSTSPATLQAYIESKVANTIRNTEKEKNDNAMIVHFTSKSDADNLCQESHVLDDAQLHVSVYHKCLMECPRTMKHVPDPFIFEELNGHIAKFLLQKPNYQSRIEGQLKSCNAKAVWLESTNKRQSGTDMTTTKLQLHCTVSENNARFHDIVDNWRNLVKDTLRNELKRFSVSEHIRFADEVRKNVVAFIRELSSDDVVIAFHSQDGYLVVAGTEQTVLLFTEKICRGIDAIESQCIDIITKRIALMDGRTIVIGSAALKMRLRSIESSRVHLTFAEDRDCLILKGLKSDVDNCYQKVEAFLKGLLTCTMEEVDVVKQKLLERTDTLANKAIEEKMNKTDTICVISIDASGQIYMSTDADYNTIKKLKTRLNNTVTEKKYQLSTYHMNSPNIARKLGTTIESKFHEYCAIEAKEDTVHISAVYFIVQAINDEVDDFLDRRGFVSKVARIEYGRFWYLQNYRRIGLNKLYKEHSEVSIEVINDCQNTGFAISGCKANVKEAIACFQELSNSVSLDVVTINWVGFKYCAKAAFGSNDLSCLQVGWDGHCLITATQERKNTSQERRVSGGDHSREDSAAMTANYTVGSCTVCVCVGNETAMTGDTLVNPCTEEFILDRETGARIVRKGGYQIQVSLQEEATKQRQYIGAIRETLGEMLDFKTIVHVATPVFRDEVEDDKLLASVMYDCMEHIVKSDATKAVLPPIGIGRFRFPAQKVARLMCKTIKQCLENKPRSSKLSEIVICVDSENMFDVFVSDLSEENDKFKLIKGPPKIKRKPIDTADVMVNSTIPMMNLDIGEFSGQLLVLAKECEAKYPKGISVGQVVATGAGQLSNKAVFHGHLPSYDGGNGYTQTALSVFVWKCLSLVNEKRFMSIAFPMLGTGHRGMPPDMVARTMFDVIQLYQERYPDTSLDRVGFLIRSEVAENEQALQKAKTDVLNGSVERKPLEVPNAFEKVLDIITEERTFTVVTGGIALSVFQGNLTEQTTAALVNSVNDITNLHTGIISRVILEAAGPYIQQECNSKSNCELYKENGLVVTSSGRLLCQNIIHVRARNSLKGWGDTVLSVLSKAERLNLSSISFPALGTGCKGFYPEDIARTIYTAVKHYGESKGYLGVLKVVNIIPYKMGMEEKMTGAITKLHSPRQGSMLTAAMPFLRRSHDSNTVTFHIYGETSSVVQSAQERLQKMCTSWQKQQQLLL